MEQELNIAYDQKLTREVWQRVAQSLPAAGSARRGYRQLRRRRPAAGGQHPSPAAVYR